MINFIRKSFSTTAYKSVIWITIISVAGLSSLTGLFKRFSGFGAQTIARVNGYDVSLLEFKRKIDEEERRIRYIKEQFGDFAPFILQSLGLTANPEEHALQALIQDYLLLDCGNALKLRISPQYVTKKLHDPVFAAQSLGDLVPPYLFDSLGVINHAALVKHLQRQGMSIEAFEEAVEHALMRSLVLSLIVGGTYVPRSQIKEQFIREHSVKKFSVISVPVEKYLKKQSEVEIPMEALRSFYDTQNSMFKRYALPEKRSGTVWKIPSSSYNITIPDAEITSYYNQHKHEFVETPEAGKNPPTYKKLEAVRSTIKEKLRAERFSKIFLADAQRIISQSSQDNALFTEFLNNKKAQSQSLNNIVLNASLPIKKLFELSQGKKGYGIDKGAGFIVELTTVVPASFEKLEDIKHKVEQDYRKEQALRALQEDISTTRRTLLNHETIQAVAKKLGGSVETLELTQKNKRNS